MSLIREIVPKASNLGRDDPSYYFQGKRVGQDPAELCSKIFYTCYLGVLYQFIIHIFPIFLVKKFFHIYTRGSKWHCKRYRVNPCKVIMWKIIIIFALFLICSVSIDPVVSALEDSYECQSGSRLNYNVMFWFILLDLMLVLHPYRDFFFYHRFFDQERWTWIIYKGLMQFGLR